MQQPVNQTGSPHDELEGQGAIFEALQLLVRSAYESPDRNALAERVVTAMRHYVGSHSVAVFEVDEEAREARLLHAGGLSDAVVKAVSRIPLEGTLTGAAVARRDVVGIQNLPSAEQFFPAAKQALMDQGMKSSISIPLVQRDVVLGVVNVAFPVQSVLGDAERAAFRSLGRTIGLAMANVDAVAALRDNEKRFRQALSAAEAGAWSWEMGTNRVHWSEENYRILGLPPGVGEPSYDRWLQCVHPDDREQANEHVRIATDQRSDLDIEYRVVWPDGSVHWINDVGRLVLSEGGHPIAMFGIQVDITARKRAECELLRSREQLRELGVKREQVVESERARISREIHDELGQALTGLKMDLSWLQERALGASHEGRQRVERALELVDRTVDAMRRIAAELRPAVLDDLGLAEAISWQLLEFAKRTGIATRGEGVQPVPAMDDERATAVFRILQEALTNVARHAEAREVTVSLRSDGDHVTMEVHDDGKGIAREGREDRPSLGLLGMKERAAALGGSIQVVGVPDRGTTVTLAIPVARSADSPTVGG